MSSALVAFSNERMCQHVASVGFCWLLVSCVRVLLFFFCPLSATSFCFASSVLPLAPPVLEHLSRKAVCAGWRALLQPRREAMPRLQRMCFAGQGQLTGVREGLSAEARGGVVT